MKFYIKGHGDAKIEFTIDELFGFPASSVTNGYYGFKATIQIKSDVYSVMSHEFYSSTYTLFTFGEQLLQCYDSLSGKAQYVEEYGDNQLNFEVNMLCNGKATVSGAYKNRPDFDNILTFEFETDQSYCSETLQTISKIKEYTLANGTYE